MKRTIFLAGVLVGLVACHDATTPIAPKPDIALNEVTAEASGQPIPMPDLGAAVSVTATEENMECVGALTGTFHNVTVPPNVLCILFNSIVTGNVTAMENSLLGAFDNQIGGSILGNSADVLQTRNNTVQGNINIKSGGPHPVFLEVEVCGSIVRGHVHVVDMTGTISLGPTFCAPGANTIDEHVHVKNNVIPPGRLLQLRLNTVGTDADISGNTGVGPKAVQTNTVARTLKCENNDPPFVGGPNVADRYKGQCF